MLVVAAWAWLVLWGAVVAGPVGAQTAAPQVSSATVDGSTLDLVFDQDLDDTSVPAADAFLVEVSLLERAVDEVSIDESTVRLTLASGVQSGQGVSVAYTPPETDPLESSDGTDVEGFRQESVTNATTPTRPVASTAVVNGSDLVITFSEELDAGSPPLSEDFDVTVGGGGGDRSFGVAATEVRGRELVVTLVAAVLADETVEVEYGSGGTLPIQDLGGLDAASFTIAATNNTPAVVPELWAARSGTDRVVLTYSRMLDEVSVPATGDFGVTVTGADSVERMATVISVAVEGVSVLLILDDAIEAGETATASYTPGSAPVQDLDGRPAVALVDHPVVDSASPIVELARLAVPEGDRLVRRMYPRFHPSVRHYALRCGNDDTVELLVSKQHDRTRLTVNGRSYSGTHLTLEVANLGRDSDIVMTLTDGADSATYVVHCIPTGFPVITTRVSAGATEGLITFTSGLSNPPSYFGLVDHNGVPRLHRTVDDRVRHFKAHESGLYPYSYMELIGTVPRQTVTSGRTYRAVILDESLEVVDYAETTDEIVHTDPHDFAIKPNGDYVLLAYESATRDFSSFNDDKGDPYGTSEPTEDSIIQVVNGDHGTVAAGDEVEVLTWNSFDHMAVEDCLGHRFPGDYAHVNSVSVASDGDLIGSFRGCSQVFKIDGTTGAVEWKVGRSNRTTETWTANLLTIVDDPLGEFCGQHAAAITSDGNLLLFDNGVACQPDVAGMPRRTNGRVTRIVEYAIDETAGTATFVRHYSYGGAFDTLVSAWGHVVALDNGNWLISWGGQNRRAGYLDTDPNTRPPPGSTATEYNPATGEEVFFMRLAAAGQNRQSRSHWVSADSVTHSTIDETSPTLGAATVSGNLVTLHFDEDLDESSVPVASEFTVKVNGADTTLAEDPTVLGQQLTLRLDTTVTGSDTVTVAYQGDTLQDVAAVPNAVAHFTARRGGRRSTPVRNRSTSTGGGEAIQPAVVTISGSPFGVAGEEAVYTANLQDGGSYSFSWTAVGPRGSEEAEGRQFRFTPPVGGLYTITVTAAGSGGGLTSTATVTVFGDLVGHRVADQVVWLAAQGITVGCGPGLFCPDGYVTRAQMAAFVVRALGIPPAGRDSFDHIGGSAHEDSINRLAHAGITMGCGPGLFCPDGYVTRAQMAAFLVRALGIPPAGRDSFNDDGGSAHEDSINRLAHAGITMGCGPGLFCPDGYVTRAQMAAFLYRARELLPAAGSS